MCLWRWLKCRKPPIRPLRQEHFSAVCKIYEECFDVEKYPLKDFENVWHKRVEETCGYFIDSKLVAFAIVIEKQEIKYLYFFGVTSELRGKGIGTKVLKHILEKVSSIYLWPISTRLTQWYEAHGFHHSSSGYYNFHKYGTRLNLNSLRNSSRSSFRSQRLSD
jgi:ribosomal protein S18 acetylase RimI-like enzyme